MSDRFSDVLARLRCAAVDRHRGVGKDIAQINRNDLQALLNDFDRLGAVVRGDTSDVEYFNITENGEVTYAPALNRYQAWDETYTNIICSTPHKEIAMSASSWYATCILGVPEPSEPKYYLDVHND